MTLGYHNIGPCATVSLSHLGRRLLPDDTLVVRLREAIQTMIVGLLALLQVLAGPADTIVVTDRVTCTTCRLETRRQVAVGSSRDSASISATTIYQILRTRARETFVLHRLSSDAAVLVYDSLGQLQG